jgi:flavin-dependent dehydrogenase
MFDVAIIGTGPAGAALARMLGAHYRVLAIDKRPFDRPSTALTSPEEPLRRPGKCCGGLVAPDAQRRLASLGVGIPRHVLTGPQLFVVRTIDVPARFERYYQRHYINVDRELFDRWLVSIIPGAVDLRFGARLRSVHQVEDHVVVQFEDRLGLHSERARLLVGADGASSRVRRGLAGGARAIRTYAAVQEWFESPRAMPYFSAIFDPSLTDFYAWTIPKGDYLLVGAALAPGRGVRARMASLHRTLREWGFGWGARVHREGAYLVRPRHPGQVVTGRGRVALVGEAAGWVSPSSAEGLSYAFASAQLLARAIGSGLDTAVARYRRLAAPLFANILAKNLKSPLMYARVLRAGILRSGLMSVEVDANDMR